MHEAKAVPPICRLKNKLKGSQTTIIWLPNFMSHLKFVLIIQSPLPSASGSNGTSDQNHPSGFLRREKGYPVAASYRLR